MSKVINMKANTQVDKSSSSNAKANVNSKVKMDKEDLTIDKDKNLNKLVKRKEVVEVLGQFIDNYNKATQYLMDDMNTLYSKQVFPFQMRESALEDILIEKGIITQAELDKKYNEKINILLNKAREIKEKNGKIEVVSKEEEKKDEERVREKVLSRLNNIDKVDLNIKAKENKDSKSKEK